MPMGVIFRELAGLLLHDTQNKQLIQEHFVKKTLNFFFENQHVYNVLVIKIARGREEN